MRNMKFLMIVLLLAVLAFSGCGGSKDSEDSSGGDTSIPNNTPDTYNTEYVLSGRWDVIDQSITIDADYVNDTTLNLTLSTASMTFANTQIAGTRGLSTITLHETWNAYIEGGDVRVYMGLLAVNLDDQVVSLIKQGADNWRGEILDTYKTVLNIEVLAENLIKLTEHRIAPVSGDVLIEYDNELTFRKKE